MNLRLETQPCCGLLFRCLCAIFFSWFVGWGVLAEAGAEVAQVTMMLSPADTSRAVFEKLQDDFNRTHPQILFRIIWSDLNEKRHLLTAADALPDLITLPDFQLVTYHNQMLDLDDWLKKIPDDEAEFYPQLLASCRHHGSMKMLPAFYNLPLLYYRPDLFRKAGVAFPNEDWTWSDYRAAAKKLTQRDAQGQVQIWGTSLEQGWWVEWLALIRQAGGDLMDESGNVRIGEPATATAIQFMHALLHEDKSAPLPEQAPPGGFASGRYAMHFGGHVLEWLPLRKTASFEWDVAPLPAGPAGKATGEFAVAGWGIWRKCKNPQAAWTVLTYLCGREAGEKFCRAGLPPVRRDVAQTEFLAPTTQAPQHRVALIQTLAFARSAPKHRDFVPLALGYVNPLIQKALADPDPAAAGKLPEELQRDVAGYVATLARKNPVNHAWMIVEIIVLLIAAGVAWRFTKNRSWMQPPRDLRPNTNRHFFLFTSPWLAGLLLLVAGPLLVSFYWSHTEYDIVEAPEYVGLSQYTALLTRDPYFWHSLKITFYFAIIQVPLLLVIALGMAMLLNARIKGIGLFRTIYYLPCVLPVAASGIVWVWFLNPRWGMVNRLLAQINVTGPGWLQNPRWALLSLVLISLWGFGGPMIIFLAGLKGIPDSLYEAASIDGADHWQRFRHVTLPMLSPILFFNLTMGLISALQVFDIAYVVGAAGPGVGEPQKSTYFYVLNLYEKSFLELKIGLGCTMAWVLFAIILAVTAVNFSLRRYWVFVEAEA